MPDTNFPEEPGFFSFHFRNSHRADYADTYLDLAAAFKRHLGRRVDLVTERSIRNPYFEKRVEATRESFMTAVTKKLLLDMPEESCQAIEDY